MPRHFGAHFKRFVPQNTQSLASCNATLGKKKKQNKKLKGLTIDKNQKSGSSGIAHMGTEHLVLPSWLSWLIFTSAKCNSGSSGLLPTLLPGSALDTFPALKQGDNFSLAREGAVPGEGCEKMFHFLENNREERGHTAPHPRVNHASPASS